MRLSAILDRLVQQQQVDKPHQNFSKTLLSSDDSQVTEVYCVLWGGGGLCVRPHGPASVHTPNVAT